MPELPDVEIVRRKLASVLEGAKVTSASSDDRRILRPAAPSAFTRALVGRRVVGIDRRGKWLRVRLDDGARVFSHLGLTGWWVARPPEAPPERFERARIDVARGKRRASVRYVDPRRFGRLLAAREDIEPWRELGPDPLLDGLDARALSEAVGERRRAIKEVLMDQSIVAGVGNILATEALWRARIDPRTPTSRLAPRDIASLSRAVRAEIQKELRAREAGGEEWHDDFAAYGRAGKPCRRCGASFVRVVLGGRGTIFCPHCQRD
ncbi:MAG TPA: bifunctional DNA-formamidopyrimidine glycosylase/DNA-(apurinic or apyrimidinic site) lyase [Polyangiaceae bacterium]|jgi:formamidopyrimidine-DNA glycosylase